MVTVDGFAGVAAGWLESACREGEDESYLRVRDGAPGWVQDLVYAAHAGMGPDDWKYQRVISALEFIAESACPEDDCGEWAGGEVDVYTGRRTAWLASNLTRVEYCDDGVAEGLVDANVHGIVDAIGVGQYMEACEVYGLVLAALVSACAEAEEVES